MIVPFKDHYLNFWVLGTPFMRSYYVIHDMENLRVGLAGKNVDLGPSIDILNN